MRKALVALNLEYSESLAADTKLPTLSISSFTKKYSLSRSVLYEDHSALVSEIKQSFRELISRRNEVLRSVKRQSASSLQKEIAEIRKEAKLQLATAASISFVQMLERCGPAFRERSQLMQERQSHLRTIEELQRQVRNQARLIQTLMAQLNTGPSVNGVDQRIE